MKNVRKRFDIFLSYTSSDKGLADRLYRILSERELSVFYDRMLSPGAHWDYELARAQQDAYLTVLIISASTPSVFYSREEVAAATLSVRHDRSVPRVVPLYVGRNEHYKRQIPSNLRDVLGLTIEGESELPFIAKQLELAVTRVKERLSSNERSEFGESLFVSNIPDQSSIDFDRPQQLERLSKAVSEQDHSRPVVLAGSPGIGKTHLALEFARQHNQEFVVQWFLRAGSHELLMRDLTALAVRLEVSVGDSVDELSSLIAKRLRDNNLSALLIFDDVVNYDLVRFWLYEPIKGRIIVTSRATPPPDVSRNVERVEVTSLEAEAAVDFMVQHTGNHDRLGAQLLVAQLGGHPLTLQLAASYMKQSGISFEEYQRLLSSDSFGDRSELLAKLVTPLLQLKDSNFGAYTLLQKFSILAEISIPLWVFEGNQKPGLSPGKLSVFIDLLKERGLILTEGASAALVHRLIRDVVRSRMDPTETRQRREEVLDLFVAGFPADPSNPETWTRCSELIGHVLYLADTPDEFTFERILTLLDRSARAAISRADLSQAEIILTLASEIANRFLGETHASTRLILGSLAVNLRGKGDLQGARRLQENLVASYLAVEGSESSNTLAAMSNLAETLRSIGDLPKAYSLQTEILKGYQQTLGDKAPQTLAAMSNLAGTLAQSGRLAEAHSLQQTILAGFTQILGRGHPDSVRAASNLAMTLKTLGRSNEALELQRSVCGELADLYGSDHPDTLAGFSNLAGMLLAVGESAEAKSLYGRVLSDYILRYGKQHPATLKATSNLAFALASRGELEEAENLNRKALAEYEMLFGVDHPSTLAVMNNLADVLGRSGRFVEAQYLLDRLVTATEQAYGPDHPLALATKNNLAAVLYRLGEIVPAMALSEQVLSQRMRTLGPDHPDTKVSKQNVEAIRQALR
jgi:tetratricopeptide (TPR) repeat protein